MKLLQKSTVLTFSISALLLVALSSSSQASEYKKTTTTINTTHNNTYNNTIDLNAVLGSALAGVINSQLNKSQQPKALYCQTPVTKCRIQANFYVSSGTSCYCNGFYTPSYGYTFIR